MKINCPACGWLMKPLFTTYFCPNGCDKDKPSDVDREPNLTCFCGCKDVESFANCDEGDVHCMLCGRVWFK